MYLMKSGFLKIFNNWLFSNYEQLSHPFGLSKQPLSDVRKSRNCRFLLIFVDFLEPHPGFLKHWHLDLRNWWSSERFKEKQKLILPSLDCYDLYQEELYRCVLCCSPHPKNTATGQPFCDLQTLFLFFYFLFFLF